MQSQETKDSPETIDDQNRPVGNLLHRRRLEKKLSLEEVAEDTCIHIATLRAIEQDDHRKMPATVFARGFIKLYAIHLGLDPDDIVNRFDKEREDAGENENSAHEIYSGEQMAASAFFSKDILVIIIAILVVATLLYFYWSGGLFPFTDNQ